jgi:hypothetical protein
MRISNNDVELIEIDSISDPNYINIGDTAQTQGGVGEN